MLTNPKMSQITNDACNGHRYEGCAKTDQTNFIAERGGGGWGGRGEWGGGGGAAVMMVVVLGGVGGGEGGGNEGKLDGGRVHMWSWSWSWW